jgi:protein-arginine kinase activator protein McsA
MTMWCQRCGRREAEVHLEQLVGDVLHREDLCVPCSREDYGTFLGALLQSQQPGAESLTAEQERELRRVIDAASAPEDSPTDDPE